MDPDLIETLREAQRFGFFGDQPIDEAAEHSRSYVVALDPVEAGSRLVDLGSGGGLPGLVLAASFPDIEIVLIDRREKRTDFLRRAVRRLGFRHVRVVNGDVATMVADVRAGAVAPFDVVTARGFGPPEPTLRMANALMTPAGRIAISDPPSGDRWPAELVRDLVLERRSVGSISVFTRAAHRG